MYTQDAHHSWRMEVHGNAHSVTNANVRNFRVDSHFVQIKPYINTQSIEQTCIECFLSLRTIQRDIIVMCTPCAMLTSSRLTSMIVVM